MEQDRGALILLHARKLLEEAENAEKENPQVARQLFLQSAAYLVEASKHAQEIEKKRECMSLANSLFQRAQQIVPATPQENGDDTIKATIVRNPRFTFKDVAGMEEVKEQIRLKIIAPLKYPKVFKRFGKKVGGGILMFGPPGCGKSFIAEATAGEAGVTFFNVKASDLKNKYVGETEKNIAKLFDAARKEHAAIIFFDEFEALGGERTSAPNSHEKNFVSELLTQIDGVGNKDQNILVIAATNVPWMIDIALRREGRFGSSILIPPPDKATRKKILELELKERPASQKLDVDLLAEYTDGFSGADIKAIVEGAADQPLKEYLQGQKLRTIQTKDFIGILNKMKPTSKEWFAMAEKYLPKEQLVMS